MFAIVDEIDVSQTNGQTLLSTLCWWSRLFNRPSWTPVVNVGRKGLEPSLPKKSVPKTDVSTNSTIAPLRFGDLIAHFIFISTPFCCCDQTLNLMCLHQHYYYHLCHQLMLTLHYITPENQTSYSKLRLFQLQNDLQVPQ